MVVAPNLSRTYKVKLKENIQATAVDVIKCLKQSKQPVPFHICKTHSLPSKGSRKKRFLLVARPLRPYPPPPLV